jgi:hypothetical protein
MPDRSQGSDSNGDRAAVPPPAGPHDHAAFAASLRRIALHQETARVLDLRASRAATDDQAALLRRRAEQHRRTAQRLRQELGAALGRPWARPSAAPRATSQHPGQG